MRGSLGKAVPFMRVKASVGVAQRPSQQHDTAFFSERNGHDRARLFPKQVDSPTPITLWFN